MLINSTSIHVSVVEMEEPLTLDCDIKDHLKQTLTELETMWASIRFQDRLDVDFKR